MSELTHGGLFSGILGFSEGFRRAGIRSLWECEWDAKCQDVIRRREPTVKVHGDVTTFNADEFECPDVITFGFPCTDISIAGKRKGVIDGETRSGLFYEATRIIARFVPRGLQFAIAENVGGLFSHDEGRTFARVLGTLGELGALDIGWATLDSQWFGLAQRRERVFIVIDFRGQRAGEVLSLAEGLCWNPAPRREAGKGTTHDIAPSLRASGTGSHRIGEQTGQDPVIAEVAATLGGGSATGGFGSDTDRCGAFIPEIAHTLRKEHDGAMAPDWDTMILTPTHDPAPCLLERDSKGADSSCDKAMVIESRECQDAIGFDRTTAEVGGEISGTLRRSGAVSDGVNNGKADVACVAVYENHQNGEVRMSDVAFTIGTTQSPTCRSTAKVLAFQQNQSGDVYQSEVVGALNTNQNASGRGTPKVMTPQYRVRRLTPTECSRLQGFPDDWNAWLSDSARYAQFGNAVSVPVAEWIGRQIVRVLQSKKNLPSDYETKQ